MRHMRTFQIGLVCGLLAASQAAAQDDKASTQPQRRRSAEILATLDQPSPEQGWLQLHLDRIHIAGEKGFQYRRSFPGRERDKELRIHGPSLHRKRVGVEIEFRF